MLTKIRPQVKEEKTGCGVFADQGKGYRRADSRQPADYRSRAGVLKCRRN
jgi:hypothetical protein